MTLLKTTCITLLISILSKNLVAQPSVGSNIPSEERRSYFSASLGYNGTAHNFIDFGVRYHIIQDERPASIDISGPAIGCEIGIGDSKGTVIPYFGWQGYYWGLAYGIRAEYILHPNHRTFSLSAEFGFSMSEILRFTVGYRIPFWDYSEDRFSKFRLSIIVAVPLTNKI